MIAAMFRDWLWLTYNDPLIYGEKKAEKNQPMCRSDYCKNCNTDFCLVALHK